MLYHAKASDIIVHPTLWQSLGKNHMGVMTTVYQSLFNSPISLLSARVNIGLYTENGDLIECH